MKFKKEFLVEEVLDSDMIVEEEVVDHTRWSVVYRIVFRFNDKFYSSHYSVGATEQQDESPYEYDPEEIECPEVKEEQKLVTVYVPV